MTSTFKFNLLATVFVPGVAYHTLAADTTTTTITTAIPDNTTTTNVLIDYFSNLRACNANQPSWYVNNRVRAIEARDEFHYYYGDNVNDHEAWYCLLETCGFSPYQMPPNVHGCMALFNTIHVNIFDLVEATRCGMVVRSFLYAEDLATYSKASGRICPVSIAKEGSLFRAMLRKFR